jgi:hypothetical protein
MRTELDEALGSDELARAGAACNGTWSVVHSDSYCQVRRHSDYYETTPLNHKRTRPGCSSRQTCSSGTLNAGVYRGCWVPTVSI